MSNRPPSDGEHAAFALLTAVLIAAVIIAGIYGGVQWIWS